MIEFGTVTLSAAVSAVISAATGTFAFLAGVRTQKNVADRQLLRDIYQALFAHLSEIRDRLVAGQPRQWVDYKLIRDEYCPLVREMELDGRANLIPARLFESLKSIEVQALLAGEAFAAEIAERMVPQLRS